MLNPIDRIPNHQMLLIETIQRGVSHRRSYWPKPMKLKFGKSLELVNDQATEKAMQMTKTPIAVAAIGSVPITDISVPERIRRRRAPASAAAADGASASLADEIWVMTASSALCQSIGVRPRARRP